MRQLQALRDSSFRAGFELGRLSVLEADGRLPRSQSLDHSLDKLIKDDFKWVVQHPPSPPPDSPNHISLP